MCTLIDVASKHGFKQDDKERRTADGTRLTRRDLFPSSHFPKVAPQYHVARDRARFRLPSSSKATFLLSLDQSCHTFPTCQPRPCFPQTPQVMNLLQMTVLAGSPGGFLPNMYPGMVAATLARVIRTSAGGSWAGIEVRITGSPFFFPVQHMVVPRLAQHFAPLAQVRPRRCS